MPRRRIASRSLHHRRTVRWPRGDGSQPPQPSKHRLSRAFPLWQPQRPSPRPSCGAGPGRAPPGGGAFRRGALGGTLARWRRKKGWCISYPPIAPGAPRASRAPPDLLPSAQPPPPAPPPPRPRGRPSTPRTPPPACPAAPPGARAGATAAARRHRRPAPRRDLAPAGFPPAPGENGSAGAANRCRQRLLSGVPGARAGPRAAAPGGPRGGAPGGVESGVERGAGTKLYG